MTLQTFIKFQGLVAALFMTGCTTINVDQPELSLKKSLLI